MRRLRVPAYTHGENRGAIDQVMLWLAGDATGILNAGRAHASPRPPRPVAGTPPRMQGGCPVSRPRHPQQHHHLLCPPEYVRKLVAQTLAPPEAPPVAHIPAPVSKHASPGASHRSTASRNGRLLRGRQPTNRSAMQRNAKAPEGYVRARTEGTYRYKAVGKFFHIRKTIFASKGKAFCGPALNCNHIYFII